EAAQDTQPSPIDGHVGRDVNRGPRARLSGRLFRAQAQRLAQVAVVGLGEAARLGFAHRVGRGKDSPEIRPESHGRGHSGADVIVRLPPSSLVFHRVPGRFTLVVVGI